MNTTQHHLDALLQQARSVPPIVNAHEAQRFLDSHLQADTPSHRRGMPMSHRTIIAIGGVMAIIAALLVVVSIGGIQPEYSTPKGPTIQQQGVPVSGLVNSEKRMEAPHPAVVVGDDSVKTKQENANEQSKDVHSNTSVKSRDGMTERDREQHKRDIELYASWTKQRIEGYTVYELDTAELARIGIVLTAGGGVLERNQGGHSTEMRQEPDGIVTYRFSFKANKDSTQQQSTQVKANNAILVTNSRGQTYSQVLRAGKGPAGIASEGNSDFMKALIPIKVPTSNPAVVTESGDYFYLYWFEPEPGFIDLLPLRVRRAIEEAQRQLRDEESREREGGAAVPRTLAASIFPNPVTQENATVEYTLPESRRVAVSMYDITGERVRSMAISDMREKGTWQDQLPIGDVPNGLYLLSVTTDQGEQSVQPIIVER
jgi:hypothetical protein